MKEEIGGSGTLGSESRSKPPGEGIFAEKSSFSYFCSL